MKRGKYTECRMKDKEVDARNNSMGIIQILDNYHNKTDRKLSSRIEAYFRIYRKRPK